jgi:hypothetical protein
VIRVRGWRARAAVGTTRAPWLVALLVALLVYPWSPAHARFRVEARALPRAR